MIALYARQSVERENSISIETQLDYCRAMIRPDERDLEVLEFIDEGFSGGNTNRDGFLKMMREIERGRVQKVIVYKLDRISRSFNDFVGILQTFKDRSVEFVSSQEAFDTSSIYGDLILKILIVFAEFERTSIIGRVRDAYAKRTDMGLYMGGRRPYGFSLQESMQNGIKTKIYTPIPKAIRQVRYIFESYAQEQISLRQLLADLAARDIKPVEGKGWTTAKLATILKNPIYVKADSEIYDYFYRRGVRIVDDIHAYTGTRAAQLYGRTTHDESLTDWSDMKLVLQQHDGIISPDIWLRCQRKLEKNRQIGNALSNHTSWLAGKLACAKCGHTMTTIKSRRADGSCRRYFSCTGKSHKKTCTGVKTTIYADDMEEMLGEYISEKLGKMGCSRKTLSAAGQAQINAQKLKLGELERQEQLLAERLLDGSLEGAMIQIANKKAEQLHKEKQAVLDKIAELKAQNSEEEVVIDLLKCWTTAKFEEKKAVVNILVRNIIIYEDGTVEIIWGC